MRIIAAAEAQNDFSSILDEVERGERMLISRNGKVIASIDHESKGEAEIELEISGGREIRKLHPWLGKLSLEEMFSVRDKTKG